MIDAHAALVYAMVMASAADRNMEDRELHAIGDVASHLPVFRGFEVERLTGVARDCARLLAEPNGMKKALAAIKAALPERLRETAYVLACEVVAADRHASLEEQRLLELLRQELELDHLVAAALERAARARYAPA